MVPQTMRAQWWAWGEVHVSCLHSVHTTCCYPCTMLSPPVACYQVRQKGYNTSCIDSQAVHHCSATEPKCMHSEMRGTFMRAACLTESISAPAASTQVATACPSCPTMLRSAWSAPAFCCSNSWRASNSSAPVHLTPASHCTGTMSR